MTKREIGKEGDESRRFNSRRRVQTAQKEREREKNGRWVVGSGVRSRFLEPFNDIPEENE